MKQNLYEFTVTCQHRYHDGLYAVEISQGGLDWSGPDMLSCPEYVKLGHGETFVGMSPAVEAAIAIAKQWTLDEQKRPKGKRKRIYIAQGNTHGMSLPLEEMTLSQINLAALRKQAREFDAELDRCAECGEIITGEKWGSVYDHPKEYDCCSERCAERRHFATVPDDEEELPDGSEDWDEDETV